MIYPHDIDLIFTHHPPTPEQNVTYMDIRSKARELAMLIMLKAPQTAERDMAINKIREAVMWTNASIACHGARMKGLHAHRPSETQDL